MANNTTLNAPSVTGGDVVATEDIGGVKHQLIKLEFGAASVATLVTASTPLPVFTPAAASESSMAGSDVSVQLLAANPLRKNCSIRNDSSATMYISFGSVATSGSAIRLLSQETYELPVSYLGALNGIWESATGNARIVEFA